MATREERLAKLTGASILGRRDDSQVSNAEVKVGYGYDNVVIGPRNFEVNHENPQLPTLKMTTDGTDLQPGVAMNFKTDFKKITFNSGDLVFQPVGDQIASTTADPLPMFTTTFEESNWAFSKNATKAFEILRGLVG